VKLRLPDETVTIFTMPATDFHRPRLVLVASPSTPVDRLRAALSGGDVASVILAAEGTDTDTLQHAAKALAPLAQSRDVAFIVENDTRVAGRSGADGVHVTTSIPDLRDALAALRPKKVVGAGNLRSRHEAMEAGELNPDYVFFGRLDGDNNDGVFDRTADLAGWWAPTFVVPAIVMAGRAVASVAEAAATGVEFVALARAVFDSADPAGAVAEANRLLSLAGQPA
jgi:thiamine-phosphate pyrophosphorylase